METVILLHGLARTSRSMMSVKRHFEGEGYAVINIDYPSRELTIQEIAERYLKPAVLEAQEDSEKIHFICHSMGAIILRYYLQHTSINKIGRVVMMAPPNGGSELIDILKKSRIARWIVGPAGCQLSTEKNSLVKQLGEINIPTGVIIGNWSWNPFFSLFISGPDDGKVSIESSKLPGMQEQLIICTSHTFIMRNRDILQKSTRFLRNGSFSKS